ncbi:MAG: 5'/3'-nucleotidase SurE [Bauldia sp.]|nr:5'/3'-nucleotidase SurE [Bauldia sp.]
MRILITNDDGIESPGLALLERVAHTISDDVWVVSPEFDHSGFSHSLTLSDPMRLRQVAPRRFALKGTPADCVIMASRRLLGGRPDLVLSGVNRGQNAADDVTYSGTVAGAIEGTLIGIPSIALSQCFAWSDDHGEVPWETAETYAPAVIRHLLAFGFPPGILYNINFPDLAPDKVTGVDITHQGRLLHSLFIEERVDPRGTPYFWLGYKRQASEKVPGTDLHALDGGAISVTPLRIDLTDYGLAARLRDHFEGADLLSGRKVAT